MSNLRIGIIAGEVAPHYPDATELVCEDVTITEQGTEAKLPIVDLIMRDLAGQKYVLVLTGRLVNGLAAAVAGINLRNHGQRDP